jgi:predicted PurR-regulated permease PerM
MQPDYQPQQRVELTVSSRTVVRVVALILAAFLVASILESLHQVILWVVLSIFFAIALNPAVVWFERRGLSRQLSTLIVFTTMCLLLVAFFAALLAPLYSQVQSFVADLPKNVDSLSRWGPLQDHPSWVRRLRGEASQLPSKLPENADALLGIASTLVTAVVDAATVLFLTLFLLLEMPKITSFFLGLVDPVRAERLTEIQAEINTAVSRYVAANLFVSVICALVSGISLYVLGVPFALVLALLSGFFDIVPLIGATIGGVIVCLVAFAHSTTAGIAMVIIYNVYQQIENHVIQPLVMKRSVQVSPFITLVAVLIGSALLGFVGALLAIPVAASIQIALREVLEDRRRRIEAVRRLLESEESHPQDATHSYLTGGSTTGLS